MKWQAYWKGILSFVSTVIGPGVVMWAQSGQPWPTNPAGWVLWAVTVFGTTGAVVAGPSNKTVGKHERSA
jgi:hypothetical protein